MTFYKKIRNLLSAISLVILIVFIISCFISKDHKPKVISDEDKKASDRFLEWHNSFLLQTATMD
jgi:hypothetical protein